MKKHLKLTFILVICLNTILNAQTKTSTIDSSIVRLRAWVSFKVYTKKEKARTIYLLKGNDTLKTYNHGGDISNGAINQGMFWHGFIYDSISPSQDLVLYVKKKTVTETGEVFLYNKNMRKKLSNFIETKDGYTCKLLPYYWSFISDNYKNNSKTTIDSKNAHKLKTGDIIAKLLYGPKKNIPLSNNKVYLTSEKGDTLKTTVTNEFGDFEFTKVVIENINILVENTDNIKNEKEIYLAKQNGTIVSIFKKTANGFTYRLLEVDITRLNEIETGEVDIKMSTFTNSTEKTITVTENIYYLNNEYKITSDISKILDVTVNNLNKNNTYKLEIYSHTDSRGDDAANLELSIKRANAVLDYLVSKGIDRKRLTAKGMGETNIINRCGNGVSCSEKEHELNRRTEFKFIK